MSEDYKVQASYKHGEYQQHMLNVRGDSAADLKVQLGDLSQTDVLADVVGTGHVLTAIENTFKAGAAGPAAELPPPTPIQQYRQHEQPAPPPPAPTGDPGQVCAHGPRQFRRGVGSKGPWAAYMCPLPQERKAEQCKPEWVTP